MIICGLKLTHDGAVALIEDGVLKFSIEMEKIGNNPRYTSIIETSEIEQVLQREGYSLAQVDHFVVDGWGGTDQDALALQPRLEIGENHNSLYSENEGLPYKLPTATYREESLKSDVLKEWEFKGLKIGNEIKSYSSYMHVTGHIMSTYMTSPFAQRGENSYVLIWDGGMYPRFYFVDNEEKKIHNLGPLFLLIGNVYTIFSQHFGPYKVKGKFAKDDLSIAGKVMAYIALGKNRPELFPIFDEIIETSYDKPMGFANILANEFVKRIEGQGYLDEDVLCTFHHYLEQLLIKKLEKKMSRYKFNSRNFCFAGGCALNIKWNSAIRRTGMFDDVYVPPFPNDSGSAIGMAAAKMFTLTGDTALNWTVYSGPGLDKTPDNKTDWTTKACSPEQLALLLHETNEPVVFLNGKAELGPRALGNRSIIAAPVSPIMKQILNKVKLREAYRPISPICMEEHGQTIFEPGTPDPFMLFDHMIRETWVDKIPAVLHIDGSARLQTVNAQNNETVHALLSAYYNLSGVPMLCNTSANLKGSGFFPDVDSVMEWGEVNYVWSEGTLYEKVNKEVFEAVEVEAS